MAKGENSFVHSIKLHFPHHLTQTRRGWAALYHAEPMLVLLRPAQMICLIHINQQGQDNINHGFGLLKIRISVLVGSRPISVLGSGKSNLICRNCISNKSKLCYQSWHMNDVCINTVTICIISQSLNFSN